MGWSLACSLRDVLVSARDKYDTGCSGFLTNPPASKHEALPRQPQVSREGQGQLLCLEKMFLGAALEPAETLLFCGISGLHREEQCLQTPTVCLSLWVPGPCWAQLGRLTLLNS